eukprot:Pgem_evm1s19611
MYDYHGFNYDFEHEIDESISNFKRIMKGRCMIIYNNSFCENNANENNKVFGEIFCDSCFDGIVKCYPWSPLDCLNREFAYDNLRTFKTDTQKYIEKYFSYVSEGRFIKRCENRVSLFTFLQEEADYFYMLICKHSSIQPQKYIRSNEQWYKKFLEEKLHFPKRFSQLTNQTRICMYPLMETHHFNMIKITFINDKSLFGTDESTVDLERFNIGLKRSDQVNFMQQILLYRNMLYVQSLVRFYLISKNKKLSSIQIPKCFYNKE